MGPLRLVMMMMAWTSFGKLGGSGMGKGIKRGIFLADIPGVYRGVFILRNGAC
jgi:hypothetical protein